MKAVRYTGLLNFFSVRFYTPKLCDEWSQRKIWCNSDFHCLNNRAAPTEGMGGPGRNTLVQLWIQVRDLLRRQRRSQRGNIYTD